MLESTDKLADAFRKLSIQTERTNALLEELNQTTRKLHAQYGRNIFYRSGPFAWIRRLVARFRTATA